MQQGVSGSSVRQQDRPYPTSQGDGHDRPGRRIDCDATGPAGAINPRSTEHLAAVTERKAGFRSLGDAWADTTTPHGRLMLTVLGGLAEFERELIRARTSEGRA